MVEAVKGQPGAIGYVEYGQAARAGLIRAQITNSDGNFVAPSALVFASTAAEANWDPRLDFDLDLGTVRGPQTYPLTTATFIIMHKSDRSSARTRRTLFFFNHALERGDAVAAELGFVPLPEELASKVRTYWAETLPGAAGF